MVPQACASLCTGLCLQQQFLVSVECLNCNIYMHYHALIYPACHFEYACIHQVSTQEKTIKPWSGNSSRRLFEPVQKRNQQALLLFSTEVLASKYYQCLCSSRRRILRHTKTSISRQTNAAAGARTIWAYAGYLQSRTCCPRFSSITLPTQASCQKYANKNQKHPNEEFIRISNDFILI